MMGTGAGFPGIPLKSWSHPFRSPLLDSLNKRVDWLGQVCAQLALLRTSGPSTPGPRSRPWSRASGTASTSPPPGRWPTLRLLCELCLPYVKVGGLFLAMKSTDSGQELEDAAHCIKLLGGRVEEPFDYVIPGA